MSKLNIGKFSELEKTEHRTFEANYVAIGKASYTINLTCTFICDQTENILTNYSIKLKGSGEEWDEEYKVNISLSVRTKLERMAMEFLETVEHEYNEFDGEFDE